MKFQSKIMLCMITIISLCFAIGSSGLIYISFSNSLQREQTVAGESYRMLLNTLEMMHELEDWTTYEDITPALDQLSSQDISSWSGLQLSKDDTRLYYQGDNRLPYLDLSSNINETQNACQVFTGADGLHYLQISGAFYLNEDCYILDVAYDISSIYQARQQQQRIYYVIFIILLIVCSVVSYLLSKLLTQPLQALSRASQEFAQGNYQYRSDIHSQDEFGQVSHDFDDMAMKLEDSIHSLEATLEAQNQFIGNFTHELKTPLTSIIGYADLLRSQQLSTEEQQEAYQYIFQEGQRLERLSLKLLQLYEIQQQDCTLVPASPSDIITQLVQHLQPAYEKEHLSFCLDLTPGTWLLEPDLFQSLIGNLIDNARKAYDNLEYGCIFICCHYEKIDDTPCCILSIADHGSGIPENAVNHLTEAFYRVDKSRSRALGGAGLGLALCQRIAELHHGSITFESEIAHGTTVTITLKGVAQ